MNALRRRMAESLALRADAKHDPSSWQCWECAHAQSYREVS